MLNYLRTSNLELRTSNPIDALRTAIKKILAFLLFSCLVLHVIGFYIVFRFHQEMIRKEMKSFLNSNKLNIEITEIEIPLYDGQLDDPDFNREEEGEFSYRGVMYDIIETRQTANSVIFRCIDDKKETDLVKKYKDIGKSDFDNSPKSKSMIVLNLISSFYTVPSIVSEAGIVSILCDHFLIYIRNIPSRSYDVITPPPRFL
jgi:hypothetical protein